MMPSSFDEYVSDYKKSLAELKVNINDELIFGQNSKSRYKSLVSMETSDKVVMVFMQVNTYDLVRIIINCGLVNKGKPIDIFANDEALSKRLDNLCSSKNITESLTRIREINDEDRILSKLKFGI